MTEKDTHSGPASDWAEQMRNLKKKPGARACWCMGPRDGDPYCPCVMKDKGWQMNSQVKSAD